MPSGTVRDFDSLDRSFQSQLCAGNVKTFCVFRKTRFGSCLGFFSSFHINFITFFSGLGQNNGFVAADFQETAANEENFTVAVSVINSHFTDVKGGNNGGVFGINTDGAGSGGNMEIINFRRKDVFFGSDDI